MTIARSIDSSNCWPALPLSSWQDTCATLHMWSQIVGKVRLALTPLVNHWWNVVLYVNARGLTTSAIPYGNSTFELQFDFVEHQLQLTTAPGNVRAIPLAPRSVAVFYRDVMDMLRAAGIEVHIWTTPVEIPNPIPFDEDETHASYDRAAVEKFWQILLSAKTVFEEFRGGSSASAAPCISSGAASIWRSHASPAGARPNVPAPTPSRAKLIRTKSAASDSGPAQAWATRRFILTQRPNRRDFRGPAFAPRPRITIPT